MTTRIFFIRHGATLLSAEDRFAGSVDVHLSEEGIAQATALGERLATEKLDAVFASPLSRTVRTAELVACHHKLPIVTDDRLREISHGHWEQMTRAEVETRYAAEYKEWEQDPFTFAPSAGESGVSVMARALPAIHEIIIKHPNQNVAVISHKATIRLILCSVLGIDARGYRDRLDQSPACLNIVDFKDPVRARLMTYNDTSHYSSQPRRAESQLSKWWTP